MKMQAYLTTAAINLKRLAAALAEGGVLVRPFHDPERMLVAIAVDTDRSQQDQVLIDVNAVDLDDQLIQPGEISGHPNFYLLGRQRRKGL